MLFRSRLSLTDLVTLALATATAISWRSTRKLDRSALALLALLLLAALRGLSDFDVSTVGNSSRLLAEIIAATLFGYICGRCLTAEQIRGAWALAAGILAISGLFFIATHGLGTYGTEGTRALDSPQALVVATWVLLVLGGRSSRRENVAAIGALALVFVSQQRTVWASTAVGLAAIALSARREMEPGRRRLGYSLIAGAAVGLPLLLLLGPSSLRVSVETATNSVSASSGTFGWRLDGWVDLLRRFRGSDVVDQVVGQPMGTGFARTVFGQQVTVSPHNMYLTVLISLGLVGLIALGTLYGVALMRTRSTQLHAAIWTVAVYSIGYQLTPPLAMILGLGLAAPWASYRRFGGVPPESHQQLDLMVR